MMRPILTSDAMTSAEERAIAAGASVEVLMERAGTALAEAIERFAGNRPVLVLAGRGNNGGDGFVAARILAERGMRVRVATLEQAKAGAATGGRAKWTGAVETLGPDTTAAPVLVDALFGTGLKRGLDPAIAGELRRLAGQAVVRIACDIPSGCDSNTGAELSPVPTFDMTVTFGALKPSHRLMPAMGKCGRIVLADIGIDAGSHWHERDAPTLPPREPAAHK
jgi:hydroxyethylthiazole kinase-like uncharacterized protein yjeF